jgi:short-subunit dehydrogenase
VARRTDKLEKVAAEIEAATGVSVTTITQDLSALGATAALERKLAKAGVQVDVLVNNAGFGTNERLVEENRERIAEEIRLNIGALVDLTAAYLPGMLERDFGAIVNIGSTASFQPVPGMAVYSSTKAFVRNFTASVWGEVESKNVRVLVVNPGATQSEFFEVANAKPFGNVMPSQAVTDTMFKALDARNPRPSVVVGALNGVTARLSAMMGTKAVAKVASKLYLKRN